MAITQTSVKNNFRYRKFRTLRSWVLKVIEKENYTAGSITLVFTTDNYLAEINLRFLDKDYFTDVITFDYSSHQIISGDILISIDRVKENARVHYKGFYDELDRVILHGLLHMMGYVDENSIKRSIMQSKEDFYLTLRSLI